MVKLGVIIVLILIVVFVFYTYNDDHKKFIHGYWEAPLEFCAKAGIKSANAFFNKDTKKAYFIINDGQQLVLNKCISYELEAKDLLPKYTREYVLKVDEPIEPLPEDLNLRIIIDKGYMALFKDDVIYMKLFKNHKITEGFL